MFDDVVIDVLRNACLVAGCRQKLSIVWNLSISADLIYLLRIRTMSFSFYRFDERCITISIKDDRH